MIGYCGSLQETYMKRIWQLAGSALYLCGIAAILSPYYGIPPLPGNETIYSVIVCLGYLLLATWAALSWLIHYKLATRMAMTTIGALIAALSISGTVRTFVYAIPCPENTIAIILLAMTILTFVLPLIVSLQEIKNSRCREHL